MYIRGKLAKALDRNVVILSMNSCPADSTSFDSTVAARKFRLTSEKKRKNPDKDEDWT